MSSVTVCNCPQNTPDPACLVMGSRPSDQQQKMPDGRTCWAGSVERGLAGCWLNAGAGCVKWWYLLCEVSINIDINSLPVMARHVACCCVMQLPSLSNTHRLWVYCRWWQPFRSWSQWWSICISQISTLEHVSQSTLPYLTITLCRYSRYLTLSLFVCLSVCCSMYWWLN